MGCVHRPQAVFGIRDIRLKGKSMIKQFLVSLGKECLQFKSILSNLVLACQVRAREVAVLNAQMASERAASEATLHDTNRHSAQWVGAMFATRSKGHRY